MDKLTSPKITRDAAGRFAKGFTANRKGRPRINLRLRLLARKSENIEDAIITLCELCKYSKNDKIRLQASTAILELSMNTNLLCKFMRRSGRTVWQYLFLPPESAEPADPNDKQMQKILEIRERYLPRLIDTMVKQQSARG